ncbi:hypothetical protein BH23CYA1_BH23CYA1_16700 [soil metagenome]
MSTTVLPQLREIESDLVTQEATLTARLEELREQLRGVRAVMPMFEGAATSTVAAPAPATVEAVETAPPAAVPDIEEPTPEEAEQPAPKAKAKRKQATSKKKKADGRTAPWQQYTRPGVKNESIPDAVKLILETQPKKDFKIAEVMDALFQEGMPKAQYLKARNRISNVLSGGVRAGDWHRGEKSTYRLTAA